MQISDLLLIIQWWFLLLFIGIIFLPLSTKLFFNFFDRGYIFSKIFGMAIISYTVFVLGVSKFIRFSQLEVILLLTLAFVIFYLLIPLVTRSNIWNNITTIFNNKIPIFIFEEALFFTGIVFWSYIRAFQPDIHGLEKYMDFGFVNSILRSDYFPPNDMWFTPYPINYYYFGHLVTAVLTKLSGIPSLYTFNLMLATLFAFTFVASMSLVMTLFASTQKKTIPIKTIVAGIITGFLVTFSGNLHTIYLFFKPYQNDNPVPPWQLAFSPFTFPNSYWYPNATRFIYHTIHEFPIYSFVVSDLHGHVLDIPFVLLTISLLLAIFLTKQKMIQNSNTKFLTFSAWKIEIIVLGFLFAVMYMTNAWDGMIYFLLTFLVICFLHWQQAKKHNTSYPYFVGGEVILALLIVTIIFVLPFEVNFSPGELAHGIGVLCAPKFLTAKGQIGPFLFEKDACQHSPIWQLFILYGFFYFWVISFIVFLKKTKKVLLSDLFILLLSILSTFLIILPEFIYVKDIYPTYQRANTMFKLVYQAFMMLSLSSGYIIVRIISYIRGNGIRKRSIVPFVIWGIFGLTILSLVSMYPYFAISSYYNFPKQYYGLDGTKYLKNLYPTDYAAINWINQNIKGQPVILEAQGDSYTDYARVSANTGLPTVLGWTVHEWLWRGSYDVPSPRINDVTTMYTSSDINQVKQLLRKYHVQLVFIGDLERQKYNSINETIFKTLGKVIYQNGNTRIYKLNT